MESYEADFEDEPTPEPGYRTYEVYQRERVGETTNLIKPRELISDEYARDPYPLLEVLRENYPCYRDWLSNCFWITRYNDVTSVFADEQNFETRPKRWYLDSINYGRDLWKHLPIQWAYEKKIDENIRTCLRGSDIVAQRLDNGSCKKFRCTDPIGTLAKDT